MTRRRLSLQRLTLLMSIWVCAAFVGCDSCGEKDRAAAIARLTELVGTGVTRDYAKTPLAWEPAALGAELALGDGARTDAQSKAELTFVNGATLQLKPGTTIRLFLDNGKAETGLDVQSGEAVLHAGHQGMTLRTHVGLAQIDADSEVVLRRDGDAMGFEVSLGRLNFKDRDAAPVGLNSGDSVDIGIGMAVLELKRAGERPVSAPQQISVEVLNGFVQGRSSGGVALGVLHKGPRDIEPGTELRLGAGAEVIVKRGPDRVRLHGPGDFTVALERALAESRRGNMSLEAMEVDVEVKVPGGTIIARKVPGGSLADVGVTDSEGTLKVIRGTVDTTLFGKTEEITAGNGTNWSHGAGLIAPEETGAIQEGPSYHQMSTHAGESFVVHTPSAPVAVAFDLSKCPGEAQLELVGGRQQSRGTGSANLLFPPGTKAYAVRCIGPNGAPGKPVARGNVTVIVDAGTRKLPARAPTSNVLADGRTYTIYYQNQLPEVALRWENAPVQAKYQLELDGKPMQIAKPEYTFRSGELKDGSHALTFIAQGRRSRTTTVQVSFDNAAPKASLTAPNDRGFAAGDTVTVEGLALPTWKVSLDGGTIAMSGGDRFSGTVKTSAEHPDVAVRLSHPRLGTHYYLRRASGTP